MLACGGLAVPSPSIDSLSASHLACSGDTFATSYSVVASFSTGRERMSAYLSLNSLTLHSFLASTTTTSKSNPYGTIIFIVIIAAIGYFLLIRPQRRKARTQQQTQSSIEVGNEIMLTSGIIGKVVSIEGDRARVEIAPGTEIVVIRAAIARQVPAAVSDDDIAVRPEADDSHFSDNPYSDDDDDAGTTPDANETPGWSAEPDGSGSTGGQNS